MNRMNYFFRVVYVDARLCIIVCHSKLVTFDISSGNVTLTLTQAIYLKTAFGVYCKNYKNISGKIQ